MRNPRRVLLSICLLTVCAVVNAQTKTAGRDAHQLYEQGMNALEGSNTTRSGADAIEFFHRSAELGFAPAQVVLGYFYETGRNTPAEPAQALD